MKVRKKSAIVDAIQFLESKENWRECEEFGQFKFVEAFGNLQKLPVVDGILAMLVRTPYCVMFAKPGDWIIKDEEGNFSPCLADYFERFYEKL